MTLSFLLSIIIMKISTLLLAAVAIHLSVTLNIIIGHTWFQYKHANTVQHNLIDLSCVDFSYSALPYLQTTDLLPAELHDLSVNILLLPYSSCYILGATIHYLLIAQRVQASCPLGCNIYTIYVIHDKVINIDYIAIAKLESICNQFRRCDFAALYRKTPCLYNIYVSQSIARITHLYLYELYETVIIRGKRKYIPTELQKPVIFQTCSRKACFGGGIVVFHGKELDFCLSIPLCFSRSEIQIQSHSN